MAGTAILIVTEDAARAAGLHEALEPHVALTARDSADARAQLAAQEVALVLADLHLKDGSGLALLEHCASAHPAAIRMLMAEHDDLPEVVQARASGMVRRLISKTARPRRVRKVVADELGDEVEVTATRAAPERGQSPRTLELLRWTIERIARVPGLVIRRLPEVHQSLQLHLVVPTGDRFYKLRRELPVAWAAPLQERGRRPTADERNHAVMRHLPELHRDAEVFASAADGDAFVYVALLPWRKEPRMTVVLGVAAPKYAARYWELVAASHRIALEEVEELALPADRERSEAGQPDFEHDWLVNTPGTERRPSGFFGLLNIFGRRRRG